LKTGPLTFGGAYTVIPFLREAAVENHHWLTSGQFNDGLSMGILPAPLIIFSTFVGYVAGGLLGAVLMTVGIFIPVALNRWHSKLTVVYVMAAAGIVGVVLQHAVV
jgi:chromate transporter